MRFEHWELEPIPDEGGWFCSTWRSPAGSAIVALFDDTLLGFSAFHRLSADEVWHFYRGDPFVLWTLPPSGVVESVVLGPGGEVQHVVPAGVWMGGHVADGGRWSLLGATMAPPFDPTLFSLGRRSALIDQFPSHAGLITRLTRG